MVKGRVKTVGPKAPKPKKHRKHRRDGVQNHADSGCNICNHPNRKEIDDLYYNWYAAEEIIEHFPDLLAENNTNGRRAYVNMLAFRKGMSNHAAVTGLSIRQLNNWRAARRQTIRKGFLDVSMLIPAHKVKVMTDILAQERDEAVAERQAQAPRAPGTNILITAGQTDDTQLTALVRAAAEQLPAEPETERIEADVEVVDDE